MANRMLLKPLQKSIEKFRRNVELSELENKQCFQLALELFCLLPTGLRQSIMHKRKGHLLLHKMEILMGRWWKYASHAGFEQEHRFEEFGAWRRVRIRKRKDRKGWHVYWTDPDKKRRSESFPSRILAEHFAHYKYAELNLFVNLSSRTFYRYLQSKE